MRFGFYALPVLGLLAMGKLSAQTSSNDVNAIVTPAIKAYGRDPDSTAVDGETYRFFYNPGTENYYNFYVTDNGNSNDGLVTVAGNNYQRKQPAVLRTGNATSPLGAKGSVSITLDKAAAFLVGMKNMFVQATSRK